MKKLWVDSHRPKTVSDYVFCNQQQRNIVDNILKEKVMPSMLLFGPPGTGKTSLAKVLFNELDVSPVDVLYINGSSQNGVDMIRDQVTGFVSVMPFGDFRYVLLDEADFITANGQAAMRNLMETFSNSARFILTANYENKIIPALHSRCQSIRIEKLNKEDFTLRCAEILAQENIIFDIDLLDSFVDASYPDMRKCINSLQQYSVSGTLVAPDEKSVSSDDYRLAAVSLFKAKKYKEGRELICKRARPEDFEQMFTFFYENLDLWADNEDQENEAILVIRNGMAKHALVSDPELNIAATLCELAQIGKQ